MNGASKQAQSNGRMIKENEAPSRPQLRGRKMSSGHPRGHLRDTGLLLETDISKEPANGLDGTVEARFHAHWRQPGTKIRIPRAYGVALIIGQFQRAPLTCSSPCDRGPGSRQYLRFKTQTASRRPPLWLLESSMPACQAAIFAGRRSR